MIADATRPATAPKVVVILDAVLVGDNAAGRICGISGRTWRRMASAGETPAPVRLGRLRRWSVEELRAWAASGCPSRARWQAMKSALEPCQAGGRINKIKHDDLISTKLRRQA